MARGDTSAIYVYLSRDIDTNNDSLITIDSDMLVTGSTDINDDIKNFIEARFSDDNSKVQIGDEDAKAVLIAFPTFIAPNANIHNGIMASVSFDKNSPQIVGTEVTVTVTLMGVAEAEGTHSVSLTGIKANLSGAEQTVTVTAGQNLIRRY